MDLSNVETIIIGESDKSKIQNEDEIISIEKTIPLESKESSLIPVNLDSLVTVEMNDNPVLILFKPSFRKI